MRLKILQSPLSNHLHLRQTATALNQAVRRYQYQHQYDGGRHQSPQNQTQSPQHLPTSGVWTPGVTRAPPRVARSSVNIYQQQYSTVSTAHHSTAQYSTVQSSVTISHQVIDKLKLCPPAASTQPGTSAVVSLHTNEHNTNNNAGTLSSDDITLSIYIYPQKTH